MSQFPIQKLREQIDEAIAYDRLWTDHSSKQDNGSYCESSSAEWDKSWRVVKAYRALLDTLQNYERG